MRQKEIDDIKAMYSHYNYQCFLCERQATQRSHIIGNTLLNRKLYGRRIIDHPLNWLPACNLDHNKKIDIGRNRIIINEIVNIIDSMGDYEEKQQQIEYLVLESIKDKEGKIETIHN